MPSPSSGRTVTRTLATLSTAVLLVAGVLLLPTRPAPAQQRKGPSPQDRLKAQIKAAMRPYRTESNLEFARTPQRTLMLDLYLPEQPPTPRLPVVVWIHGGGWKSGDRSKPPAEPMAGFGYAVASIGYRLSQEAPFPAQIEDCRAAIRWLRASADRYGLDPERIGVWGSSAGGHLAALLGTASDRKEWDVGDHLDQSARVQAVCDFFGPADLTTMSGPRIKDASEMLRQFLGGPLDEKKAVARLASPLAHVSKGDPPFFIAHGTADPLVPVDQSTRLHQALQKARVPSTLLLVPKAGHGFSDRTVPTEFAIKLQVLRFFDAALKVRRR